MLAVGAAAELVEQAIRDEGIDLVVANRNAPQQVVLSGDAAEIDRADALFAKREIRRRKLPVSAAFHSPLVAGARERFRPVLDDVELAPAAVPVFANSTAQEYPDDPDEARELLASQLARPVEFVRQIENMYESGVHAFFEVGPGATLTSLVSSILGDREHVAVALDASRGKRSNLVDLACSLAQLSALGHAVDWTRWDPSAIEAGTKGETKVRTMTVPISGANYVKPRPQRPARPVQAAEPVKAPEAAKRAEPMPTNMPQPLRQSSVSPTVAPGTAPAPTPSTSTASLAGTAGSSTDNPLSGIAPSPAPAAPANVPAVNEAYLATQENLLALQRMQEQTARLHQQFLQGQELALQTFQALAAQQQQVLSGASLMTAAIGSAAVAPAATGTVLSAPPTREQGLVSPPVTQPTPVPSLSCGPDGVGNRNDAAGRDSRSIARPCGERQDQYDPAGSRRREDRLSGRDAPAGDGTGRGLGH